MDLSSIPQLARNANRLKDIFGILGKYGFADWVSNINVDVVRSLFGRRSATTQLAQLSREARIRMASAELGTTFIKLGQMLSTRIDIVGPALAEELSALQEGTPADPPDVVRATIREEFGKPVEELFAQFDEKPMGSASIGQVHAARLHNGQEVVVKVQHKGIEAKVNNDLDILSGLAELIEKYDKELRQYQPVAVVNEFRRSLLREMDFSREARNLRQFCYNFRNEPKVKFPAPYMDLSAKRVLTMERLDGIKLTDRERLTAAGADLAEIAQRGAAMYLEMIFRDGFYHADPHPGNLLILPNDVIGVLDCGMVGRLDEVSREAIENLVMSAISRDPEALTDQVIALGSPPIGLDRDALRAEVTDFVADHVDVSLTQFDLSGALNGIVDIVRRYHIILPPNLSLLLKVLIMLEGTSKLLNPNFSLAELLKPYQGRFIQEKLSPTKFARRVARTVRDWDRFLDKLPREMANILERVNRGTFDVNLEHRRLDTAINRLVFGLVTSALFVGSSLMLGYKVEPAFSDISIPGAVGAVLALGLGLRLLRAIVKSGNLD